MSALRFGYWLPVFGGWLRNVEDERMEATWRYVRDLAVRSDATRLAHAATSRAGAPMIILGLRACRLPVRRGTSDGTARPRTPGCTLWVADSRS